MAVVIADQVHHRKSIIVCHILDVSLSIGAIQNLHHKITGASLVTPQETAPYCPESRYDKRPGAGPTCFYPKIR